MNLSRFWKDPPPALAFEISEAGIAWARFPAKTPGTPEMNFRALAPGVLSVSPVRDNVLMPDELASSVRTIPPPNGRRREAALILPDYCARIAVLDFDGFPADTNEQRSLVRFRMKKSVPFDVESAAIGYFPQPAQDKKKIDVVVTIAPLETVARYEAPFRAAGMIPGLVTVSALAAVELLDPAGVKILAKLAGNVLTILVLERGALKLVRSLELGEFPTLADIASDVYPTFAYVEDNLGAKAGTLVLCGFGTLEEEAVRKFARELEVVVEPLRSPWGPPGPDNAGLLGYLSSLEMAA
ncbi:MAG: hypothetical protein WD696_01650 [Bryobacteraceae bacterium]